MLGRGWHGAVPDRDRRYQMKPADAFVVEGIDFPVVHNDIAIYEMEYMVMCIKFEWLYAQPDNAPINWEAFQYRIV
jgi:hypothetical protein